MEIQQIIQIAAQIAALVFVFSVGIVYLFSAKKDGTLSGDEVAKISIIGIFIFMMVMNGFRSTEPLIFDSSIVLIVLASVLALAGIDIAKNKDLFNGDRRKNSTDGK